MARCLLYATCVLAAAASWIHGDCSSMRANTCVVTGNKTFLRKKSIRFTGNIVFRRARWECSTRLNTHEGLQMDISVTGSLSLLEGSLLHCATITIQASSVFLSDDSQISANGTSHAVENAGSDPNAKLWSSPQRGASHGGLGGTRSGCSSDDAQLKRLSLAHGDPFAPWEFGRAAGPVNKRGAGGGRIRVTAQSIYLNGSFSAAGAAPDDSEDDETAACGSGGSIWISSAGITQPPSSQPATIDNSGQVDFVDDMGPGSPAGSKGRILAPGGCCRKCLCGGGGRVLTEVSSGNVPRNVMVAGGCFKDVLKMDGEGCRCGSAGTWAFSNVHQGKKRRIVTSPARWAWRQSPRPQLLPSFGASALTLRVDNSFAVSLAGAKLPQPTPLAFHGPVALQVNDAVVVPSEEDANWLLSSLSMLSDQTGSTLKHLGAGPLLLNFSKTNDGLELAFSSFLQARDLQILNARHITLRQNAAIDASTAKLVAEEINAHQGALGQGEGAFRLQAQRIVLGSGRLRSGVIIAEEELVMKRGSRLQSNQRRCDQSPAALGDPCERILENYSADAMSENVSFDIVLVSRNGSISIEEDAEIYAGAFLLCSTENVSVRGLVSARGLGCAPNRGEGPGTVPQKSQEARDAHLRRLEAMCGGGGGAHCGNGGDGVRNRTRARCLGTGGLKYDGWWTSEMSGSAKPSRVPTWSASGGGGDSAGAGGGLIWIRSKILEMPSNSTSLSANGEDAVAWSEGGLDGSGGGGGGTVILNVTMVNGSAAIEAPWRRGMRRFERLQNGPAVGEGAAALAGLSGGGGGGGAIGSAGANASQVWAAYSGLLDVFGGLGDASSACRGMVGERGCEGELLQLAECRPGHVGIKCEECPEGTYNPPQPPENLTATFRICLPCKNKPAQGYYTASGWLNESCPYACPSGFPPVEVNPECNDPWSYYFDFFGGVWGVLLLTLLTAVLFCLLISAKRLQTRRRLQWLQKQRTTGARFVGMNDEAMLLFESLRGRHPLADLDVGDAEGTVGEVMNAVHSLRSRTVGESRPRWLLGYVTSFWRKLWRGKRHSGAKKEAHLLHVGDLPYHMSRIYFLGENMPRDPWRLSMQVPEELRPFVEDRRWSQFAEKVNKCCSRRMRLQLMAEGVLRWLYLPVAEYTRWRLRFARAADVAAFVWSLSENSIPGETFWRLNVENSSRFGLKFGTDREMTMAYIDILDYCKTLENWVVKPQLPMIIAAAGDGEYTAPYHLDYADPFVQSAAQYLSRRTWHQVLLPFNLLARLLPPNPTEEDLKPLRRSMQRVSSRALLQTDIECHAVLFEVCVPNGKSRRRRAADMTPTCRQSSWEVQIHPPEPLHEPRTSKSGWNSSDAKSPGQMTPVVQQGELVFRRRLALVLTQRANTGGHWAQGSTSLRDRLSRVMPTPGGGLVSPTEFLNCAQFSPQICPSPLPDIQIQWPELPELDFQDTSYQSFDNMLSDSMIRQRSTGRGGAGALSAAFRDCGWSADSEPLSPQVSALSGGVPSPPLARPSFRLGSLRCPGLRQGWNMCLEFVGASFVHIIQRLEAILHFVAAPGNHIYHWYLKKLRAVRAIGGVGRQTGLYLRHRKPRGSQESTLLYLMLTLVVATLGFIAQSAILFRLQPRHSAFFAALLLPPFADILALVNITLFLCGAADGTTSCLFVVASNWNSHIGLLYRLMAMERWRSAGLLHVLGEYVMVFAVKVFMCRLVNLTIAYYEAEPALLEPGGNDADHDWVREHVLFRPVQKPDVAPESSPAAGQAPEENFSEQNTQTWLVRGLETTRTALSQRFQELQPQGSEVSRRYWPVETKAMKIPMGPHGPR
ncbi:unnamed protein product [Effrenium voratum]|uniref:DUF8003 domain-containing protein n=1 Tax=Effrenium voratum TaxID=2562239 RepID=A0AA36JDL8_9DINO|nr:unnamed protein product [Effrenium voratum]